MGKPTFKTMMAETSCECAPCETEKPVACTLDAKHFKAQALRIAEVAAKNLGKSSLSGSKWVLRYDGGALERLSDLVTREKACCAFLDFDLREIGGEMVLTITAPASSADARLLFAHFAPDHFQQGDFRHESQNAVSPSGGPFISLRQSRTRSKWR
jgi:hypothetical protein